MEFETERLILRAWADTDAEECYKYAKDPRVGYPAGWPAHKDIEETKRIIRDVLSKPETYAIVLKETMLPVGCISLMFGERTDLAENENECELGYWLGVPYWGRGIMPEAVEAMLRHAFEDLGAEKVWCGYYEGNVKSRRVQEKCGFSYVRTTPEVDVPRLGEKRTGHVNCMTRTDWETRGVVLYKRFGAERIEEVKAIYAREGWQAYLGDDEKLARAFDNSLYILGAFCGGRLAGFVRCVGDGEHVLLVQDLIVDRAFRGRNIGKTLFSSVAARFSGVRMFCVFTDIGNARACAFYRSFGMEPIDSGNMIAFFRKRSS